MRSGSWELEEGDGLTEGQTWEDELTEEQTQDRDERKLGVGGGR